MAALGGSAGYFGKVSMASLGWILALLAGIALVVVTWPELARRWRPVAAAGVRYHKASALFTPAERAFLAVLGQAIGDEFRIFGKVRVADVLIVNEDLDTAARQEAFSRIASRHFDFVLCSKKDLSAVCALELDDPGRKQDKRRVERDIFLEEVCAQAGLPLLRITAQRGYVAMELRTLILDTLSPDAARTRNTAPQTVSPATMSSYQLGLDTELPVPRNRGAARQPTPRQCPDCGAAMVLRRVRAGADAGASFWGCSNHPACLCVIPSEK